MNINDTVTVTGEIGNFVLLGYVDGGKAHVHRTYGNRFSPAGETTVRLYVNPADLTVVRSGNAQDDALSAYLAEADTRYTPRPVSAETHIASDDADFLSHLMTHSVDA